MAGTSVASFPPAPGDTGGAGCICMLDVRSLPEAEAELLAPADTFPPARREKILKRRGMERRRALGAGLLLGYTLAQFGLEASAAGYEAGGRPLVMGRPELSLSLSHSGAFALCLLAEGEAALDVQEGRRVSEALVRRCFGTAEQALYFSADTPEAREAVFLRLWCRLESRVKLRQDWAFRGWDLLRPEPGFRWWRLPLAGYGCALYAAEEFVPPPVRMLEYAGGELRETGLGRFVPD